MANVWLRLVSMSFPYLRATFMNNRKMKVHCFSTQCRKMWLFHTGAGKCDFVSSFCCSFGSPTVRKGHSFSIYCVYKDKSTCTNDFPALVHFISESWCLFWKFLNSVGPLGQPHSEISTQTPRLRKEVNSCRENICTLGLFFYTLKLRRKVLFNKSTDERKSIKYCEENLHRTN